MLFIGDDWAEAHHDIEIVDEQGGVLAKRRLPEGVEGIVKLHELVADHLDDHDEPDQVLVEIETDRGPWVQALIATGYVVYAINPLQAARYRERHGTSGAKSDPGDATSWPKSSVLTVTITALLRATQRSRSRSKLPHGPIRR